MAQEELLYKLLVNIELQSRVALNQLKELQQQTDKMESSFTRLQPKVGQTETEMAKLGTVLSVVHNIVTRVFDAISTGVQKLTSFISGAIGVTARVKEMGLVLDLFADRIGMSTGDMDRLVLSVKDLGITTGTAQQAIAQFIRYDIDLAKATDLARVAQDAAVLSMEDSSETLDRLIWGITTQNTRVLRQAGLMVNLDKSLKEYAATLGKTRDELDAQERVQATLNAVLEEGARIEGAYETAMQSASKQMRSMARYLTELQEAIGIHLHDAYTAIVFKLADFVQGLRDAAEEGGALYGDLQKLGQMVTTLASEGFPRLLDVLEGILKAGLKVGAFVADLVERFRELHPAIQAGLATMAAVLPPLTALYLLLPKLTLAIGALETAVGILTGPVGILTLALGALAAAFIYLRQKQAEQRAELEAQKAAFEAEKGALLDAAQGADEYARRALALSEAHGGVIQTSERVFNATTQVWEAVDRTEKALAKLRAEWLVHVGTLNIAQAGFEKLRQKLGEAEAAEKKFGEVTVESGRGIRNWYEELQKASAQLDEYAAKTGEAFSQIQTQMTSAFSSISDALSSQTKEMAQLASNYRLAEIRATAEFNAEHARLVAAGLTDEAEELKRSYEKAKILRELDHEIAVAQAKAKHQAELKERMAAFAEKLVWWLFERKQELNIQDITIQAVIKGLGAALGEEVAMRAQAAFDVLKITEEKGKGVLDIEKETADALKRLWEAAQKGAEEAGKAYDLAYDEIEKATQDAFNQIAALAGPGVKKAGEAVKKAAEEVIADTADMLERLTKSIAATLETLKTKLPTIPATTLGEWLDRLYELAAQAADWLVKGAGKTLLRFIEEWERVYGPQLEKWAEQMRVLVDLVRIVADLTGTLSEELAPLKANLTQFLERLWALTQEGLLWWARQDYVTVRWVEMWGERGLTSFLETWYANLGPLAPLLSLIRDLTGSVSEKLADAKTALTSFFDKLWALTQEGLLWWARQDYVLVRWVELWEEKGLSAFLTRWADTLKPLQDILSVIQGILKIAASKLEDVNLVVVRFFDTAVEFIEEVNAYLVYEHGFTRLDEAIGGLIQFKEAFERWEPILQAFSGVLSVVQGILGTAASKVQEVLLVVRDFFDTAVDLIEAVNYYLVYEHGFTRLDEAIGGLIQFKESFEQWETILRPFSAVLSVLQGILGTAANKVQDVLLVAQVFFDTAVDLIEAINYYLVYGGGFTRLDEAINGLTQFKKSFELWEEVLKPLQAVLSVVQGILGISSQQAADVQLSVQKLFDNLLNVVQQVIDYLSTNALRLSGAIAGLSAHSETLGALKEALEPLKAVLDVIMPILSAAATSVEGVKFGLTWVFDNMMKLMGEVETWITNQGPTFTDDMIAFREQFQPALDAFRLAVEPIGQLGATIDTVLSQMEKLNPSRVHTAFINYLRETLRILLADLTSIKPLMDEIQPLADQIAEIMKNINVALQVCLGLLAFAAPEEEAGYETGLMEGVLIALNLAIANIKEALNGFYNWLNGPYRAKLASLSYYDEGYKAGKSWLDGFKDGSGQHSPSVPMLEAGQNLIKGLIVGIESMIPALDKTLQNIVDRFVGHSPIKTGPLAKIDWDDFPVIGPGGPIGPPPPPPIPGGEEVFEEVGPFVPPGAGAPGGGQPLIIQIASPPIQVMGDVIVRREEDFHRWRREMQKVVVEMLPDVIVPAVDASQDKKAKQYGRFGVQG